MRPLVLREQLRDRGVGLSLLGGQVKVSDPNRVLTPALLSEMKAHKPQLLAILQAESEYERIHGEICRLYDAAEMNELYGATAAAKRQMAEVDALVQGPYALAREGYTVLIGPDLEEIAEVIMQPEERLHLVEVA